MPTLCSMCGGTYGKCEGCKKADSQINDAAKKLVVAARPGASTTDMVAAHADFQAAVKTAIGELVAELAKPAVEAQNIGAADVGTMPDLGFDKAAEK